MPVHSVPIDIAEAKRVVSYCPETGLFTRLIDRPGGHAKAGSIAGVPDSHGYLQFAVGGRLVLAHRLAYCITTGKQIPDGYVIDHIDGCKTNNTWGNLRCVSRGWNQHNKWSPIVSSRTQVLGVRRVPSGRYVARVVCGTTGKRHTRTCDTIEQAREAYLEMKQYLQPGARVHGKA